MDLKYNRNPYKEETFRGLSLRCLALVAFVSAHHLSLCGLVSLFSRASHLHLPVFNGLDEIVRVLGCASTWLEEDFQSLCDFLLSIKAHNTRSASLTPRCKLQRLFFNEASRVFRFVSFLPFFSVFLFVFFTEGDGPM